MDQNLPVLVMMRHGQSEWNKKNLFTGWVDVPLSLEGIDEAVKGGKKISAIPFDVIFVSTLVRAQLTAFIAMSQHREGKTPVMQHEGEEKQAAWSQIYSEKAQKDIIPVYRAMELNERMYGRLQGKNKDETRAEFGAEQVKLWRRSFDVSPPDGESLAMTKERALPYFENTIVPYLADGKNVFVSAHGNSLRAIVMVLDNLSKEEVLRLEIPTGEPLCYLYDNGKWRKKNIEEVQAGYGG
ncbi:MAG: 2,3-bisphosphoglycerate-dependent phosphoglycerate mutase [Simkaniaceae bacterium]